MEMNSANVEEVVKQVLESMLKTPVSAAPQQLPKVRRFRKLHMLQC